ncbi:hypothetical protein A2U01_0019059, partial [Trifolium medium]|nr:hypothetical protein [Trifolium medium]
SEVAHALQQVAWRRQQRFTKPVVKEFRKVRQWQRFEAANVKEGCNSSVDYHGNKANFVVKETRVIDKSEELKFENKVETKDDMNSQNNEQKKDTVTNHQSDGILNRPDNSQGSLSSSEFEAASVNEGTASNSRGSLPVDYDLNDNI